MADLAQNEVWQMRVGAYTADQAAINTIHFIVLSTMGVVTDQDAADHFDGLLSPLYRAIMSDDANYRGVSFQRVFPLPRTRAAISIAGDGPGTVVGEILPGQVAGIISAKTAFAGRKQRARVYLPFPSEASSEPPGVPVTTYVQNAQVLATSLYAGGDVTPSPGVNEAELRAVVWHRETSTYDIITTSLAKKLWATQRRRGGFGQRNLPPF